jgi:HK97 family phage major capsid protein
MENTGLNDKASISLEQLNAELGANLENFEEVVAVVKNAKKKNVGPEFFDNIQSVVEEAVMKAQASATAKAEVENKEEEAAKFKELEEKGIKAIFDDAPIEQKRQIHKWAEEAYGTHAVDLSFFGGKIEKMLQAPMSRKDGAYEDMLNVKHAHDLAISAMAVNGESSDLTTTNKKFDKRAYAKYLRKIADQGDSPAVAKGARMLIETYEKTLGDAMDSLTATDGLETIPEFLSNNVIEEVWLTRAVHDLFKRNAMPSPTWNRPRITSMGRAYLMDEPTLISQHFEDLTTTDPFQTDDVTWNASCLAHSVFYSKILTEDSILDMAARCLQDSKDGIMNAIEDATINGNKGLKAGGTGSDLDNDLWTSLYDARNAWDGIRISCDLSTQGLDLGTFNMDNYTLLRKKMGKWGMNVTDLVNIVSPATYFNMLMVDEFLTVDKFPGAVNVTGALGAFQGIPIVASEYVYENLNASGVYDGMTENNSIIIITRKDAFEYGDRRQMIIERDYRPLSQQNVVVASWRGDFQAIRPGRPEVAIGYNVAV